MIMVEACCLEKNICSRYKCDQLNNPVGRYHYYYADDSACPDAICFFDTLFAFGDILVCPPDDHRKKHDARDHKQVIHDEFYQAREAGVFFIHRSVVIKAKAVAEVDAGIRARRTGIVLGIRCRYKIQVHACYYIEILDRGQRGKEHCCFVRLNVILSVLSAHSLLHADCYWNYDE